MYKKIVSLVLSFVICLGVLSGCLFEHNFEKDYRQVVAEIKPITETRDGDTYTTKARYVYKSELINYINSYAGNLMSQYDMTAEQAVKYVLDNYLITRHLLLAEAEISLHFGDIVWDYTAENDMRKLVYNSIDSQLKAIKNEILTDRDLPTQGDPVNEDKSTTYPVMPEETDDEDEVKDTELWQPDKGRYPGLYGTDDEKSLDNEAMRQFIRLLFDSVKEDFRATEDDKAKFKADETKINDIITTQGIEYVYKYLFVKAAYVEDETKDATDGEYYLYVVDWLMGKSAREQIELTLLQENIEDSVSVSRDDVEAKYEIILAQQEAEFTDSTYKTALDSGTDPVLYFYNTNYFYVNHILIPFSDAQKAELTKYKSVNRTKEQVEAYRTQLANEIVAYAHVDGEDDKTNPMTVAQIFAEVKGRMSAKAASPYEAERTFKELIYKYNTDTGAFGNEKGYLVAYELAAGENETYMVEFAEGARKLRDEYKVGEMLPEYVITDYGVHIMYYQSDTKNVAGKKVGLNDYLTPGGYSTYYDIIEKTLHTAKEDAAFSTFQNERVTYYDTIGGYVVRYDSRFKDLYSA